jgi:transcriptional regulator with XRE-family HTH domain
MDWASAGAFLKEQRRRIPRDASFLGRYARLPARHGKFVTQEELAEAIGVSRVWYAMLESGTALKTSSRLLARLAEALGLSDEGRQVLFKLALPKPLGGNRAFTVLKDLSGSVAPLRASARRLWSATSESEILLASIEAIAGIFDDSDFSGAFKRIEPGRWDYPVVIGGEHLRNAIAELDHSLREGLTPAQIDETKGYSVLTQPGQVRTRHELYRHNPHKDRIDQKFAGVGFGAANFIETHVKSRDGIEATAFTAYVNGMKDFTELDREILGALAVVASLALSG